MNYFKRKKLTKRYLEQAPISWILQELLNRLGKYMTTEKKEALKKWGWNLLKFTAPVLAVLFFQLSQGIGWQEAYALALYALYASLYDLFKKIK